MAEDEKSVSAMALPGILFTAAFLAATLLMRGPVTSIGPIAAGVRETFGIGPTEYGLLTAIPIAAFGAFSFIGPVLKERLGLRRAITTALLMLALGALGRVMSVWAAMLLATVFVGGGIALLNVYMPVVVRAAYMKKIGLMMGIYTGVIGLSGSIGGLTSAPLFSAFGTLKAPMGAWAAAAVAGTVVWLFFARDPRIEGAGDDLPKRVREKRGTATVSLLLLARYPTAWALTAVMGLQSLLIYTVSAWVPPYWASFGMRAEETGVWLFIYLVSGLPASIFTAHFMRVCRKEWITEAILAAFYFAGVCGWLWGGHLSGATSLVVLFASSVMAGASQGAMLSVAFLLMAKKSSGGDEMLRISSFAQGIGYLGAGFGPMVFGLLFEASGGWILPFGFVLAVIVLWGAAGWVAGLKQTIR